MVLINLRERPLQCGAEGATTPETLRQKDRNINSGKKKFLAEGVNLSGTQTEGVMS